MNDTTNISENTGNPARQTEILLPAALSLRDYFAAQAMTALVMRANQVICVGYLLAKEAYLIADVMLVERAKEKS